MLYILNIFNKDGSVEMVYREEALRENLYDLIHRFYEKEQGKKVVAFSDDETEIYTGIQTYKQYLETMKAYNFCPMNEESWIKRQKELHGFFRA